MAETWFKIGGKNLSFRSRPIKFLVETTDGSDYTLVLENGESGIYSSGGTKTIIYSGTEAYPKFSIVEASKVKRFEVNDTLYVDTSVLGWSNIERLVIDTNASGNVSNVENWTNLTYLRLYGNSLTGNTTGVSSLTSLTYLYLRGDVLTGVMTNVSSLTSLTYLYLYGNGFTGNMTGSSSLTSLTTLYLRGSGFTGNMTGISSLTSLTTLYLNSNGFTGDMTGVSFLTLLDILTLNSSGFEWSYTSTLTANFSNFNLRLKTGELSTAADIDQMFIDINAAATTKSGTIDVRSSGAAAPTATSLAARNALVAKGRTILTN